MIHNGVVDIDSYDALIINVVGQLPELQVWYVLPESDTRARASPVIEDTDPVDLVTRALGDLDVQTADDVPSSPTLAEH